MASIDKKNGKYRVRVSYFDENNKRKFLSRSGIDTKSQANRIAHELEANKEKYIKKSVAPTLKDYVDKYIEIYRVGKVSESSVEIDKYSAKRLFSTRKKIVENDKVKYIDVPLHNPDIRIDKVTNMMHQEVINKLIDAGKSISTLKKTNSLMYRVMEKARYDGYITFNPAEFIEYKVKDTAKKAEYIPHDKIEPFLTDVKRRNIYHYYLFRLIIETGLRVGEACALTWQDIDRVNNIIHVKKSYDQKRNKLGNTKTKNHRDIYITKSLLVELFKLMQIHNANKINYESVYSNDNNFIFVDDIGKPISRSSIHNTMIYCSKKVLGHQISVHKLRHTHATLLLESNVPIKVIQERLGHQSLEMTEKTYAHVTPKLKTESLKDFEKYIKNVF